METEQTDARSRWEIRIRRAQELILRHSAISNAMRFYEATLEFQSEIAARSTTPADPTIPLRQQIDLTAVFNTMPSILAVSLARGPDALRADAQRLKEAGEGRWRQLIEAAVVSTQPLPIGSEETFCPSLLAAGRRKSATSTSHETRIITRMLARLWSLPQLAILRAEGKARAGRCSVPFACVSGDFAASCVLCAVKKTRQTAELPFRRMDIRLRGGVRYVPALLKAVEFDVDGRPLRWSMRLP